MRANLWLLMNLGGGAIFRRSIYKTWSLIRKIAKAFRSIYETMLPDMLNICSLIRKIMLPCRESYLIMFFIDTME